MKFARIVFAAAGLSGIATLVPMYFLPAGNKPELLFGFVGVALAWQVMFLAIAREPAKLWPVMPVAVLEKVAFGLPVVVLHLQGRVGPTVAAFALLDLLFGVLFLASFFLTARGNTKTSP